MSVNQIIIAVVVGLLVALIVTSVMRSSLKSVGMQHSASYYVKPEGLRLTKNKDIYMYQRTERFVKPKEQPRQQPPKGR